MRLPGFERLGKVQDAESGVGEGVAVRQDIVPQSGNPGQMEAFLCQMRSGCGYTLPRRKHIFNQEDGAVLR